MKRTPIDFISKDLPSSIQSICQGCKIYDSSCSQNAKVYFIDRDYGYYLKISEAGSLEREALMTNFFHKKGIGTEIFSYYSDTHDIMLTKAALGEDCTNIMYTSDPKRLCETLAETLRMLHSIDPKDCPVQDRIGEYISLAEKNYFTDKYNKEHFPDSFGYKSGEEAWNFLSAKRHLLKNEVIIHGDYCLPNIMLDNWKFSSFIDLGNSGIGDRHIDLFWGQWSIEFNLKLIGNTDAKKYGERFLDAYGRDLIDDERMRIVASAEVFG